MGQDAAGTAALSRRSAVSGRSAEAAVRRDGEHAAAADGRRREDGRRYRPDSGEWHAAAQPAAGPLLKASDTDSWMAVNRAWRTAARCGATRRAAISRLPRSARLDGDCSARASALPELGAQHGRRLDALAAGAVRLRLHQRAQRGYPGRAICATGLTRSCFRINRPRVIDRGYTTRHAGGIYRRPGRERRRGPAGIRFVAGGTLVFLNRSTEYAIQRLGVKAKNVVDGASNRDFYVPGSLLNVKLTPGHPLTLGLPDEIPIWSEHSPAWETDEPTVARYPRPTCSRQAGCSEKSYWRADRRSWMRAWARVTRSCSACARNTAARATRRSSFFSMPCFIDEPSCLS